MSSQASVQPPRELLDIPVRRNSPTSNPGPESPFGPGPHHGFPSDFMGSDPRTAGHHPRGGFAGHERGGWGGGGGVSRDGRGGPGINFGMGRWGAFGSMPDCGFRSPFQGRGGGGPFGEADPSQGHFSGGVPSFGRGGGPGFGFGEMPSDTQPSSDHFGGFPGSGHAGPGAGFGRGRWGFGKPATPHASDIAFMPGAVVFDDGNKYILQLWPHYHEKEEVAVTYDKTTSLLRITGSITRPHSTESTKTKFCFETTQFDSSKVDSEHIEAKLSGGMLVVELPKQKTTKESMKEGPEETLNE